MHKFGHAARPVLRGYPAKSIAMLDSSTAPIDDVVIDASDSWSRPSPSAIGGSFSSIHWASVDWRRSLEHTSRGVRLAGKAEHFVRPATC